MFFNFNRNTLLFWAIFLDIAADCVDFCVAFDGHCEHCKSEKRLKRQKKNRLEQLEQRSQELEAEVELLKRKLSELTKDQKTP
jgi:N-glycosylase/DNA lyase